MLKSPVKSWATTLCINLFSWQLLTFTLWLESFFIFLPQNWKLIPPWGKASSAHKVPISAPQRTKYLPRSTYSDLQDQFVLYLYRTPSNIVILYLCRISSSYIHDICIGLQLIWLSYVSVTIGSHFHIQLSYIFVGLVWPIPVKDSTSSSYSIFLQDQFVLYLYIQDSI